MGSVVGTKTASPNAPDRQDSGGCMSNLRRQPHLLDDCRKCSVPRPCCGADASALE
jgi:hypothetical protein